MGRLIGYARVSTRVQDTDRQIRDLLAAGVRRDDLYVDHGVSGAQARRPQFDQALDALHEGDTLVVTTLDRLGRSTANMLLLADTLRAQAINLQVLNLGGGNVDTETPMGSMVFTVMAALAQMELEIKRERVNDSNTKRRAAGMDLGGRRETFSDSQISNARRLIYQGQPASHVARDLGMSRATLYRRINALDAQQWLTTHPAPVPLPLNDTTTAGPSMPLTPPPAS
ncbi:recombinase family protein [Arthrobacter echini]|uniref:Recombinase family protein n=2 Tax=Arthrobacter echini TaxID=1529066 RepID=A0A4S5E077_9MICC|nr:recombinase family protein [Arthrobacter echini]THJ64698.1 recombinase family protein [Arthrobacter echini]TYC97121.1 recombinase family protein [Arthrobacter echini]